MKPKTHAFAMDEYRSGSCASAEKPWKYAPGVTPCTTTLKKYPPAIPATLTSETRNTPTVDAAKSRGVTRRCTGFTAMTSMAAISSRIFREPRSAVIAEPPAPAISSAVATGEASRTMARTIAAPVADSAPSCRFSVPTCNAMTAPNGMAINTLGNVQTLAMNQHCSRYSRHQRFTSQARRSPSSEMAKRFPDSLMTNWTLPIIRALHRHDGVGSVVADAFGFEAAVFSFDEIALDLGLLGRELVHPDRPASPTGEELTNDRVVGCDHLVLRRELHEPGAEQHADVVGGAHHRRDVVRDDEEGRTDLFLDLARQFVEVRHAHWVETGVRLVEQHDLGVHDEGTSEAGPLAHAT